MGEQEKERPDIFLGPIRKKLFVAMKTFLETRHSRENRKLYVLDFVRQSQIWLYSSLL